MQTARPKFYSISEAAKLLGVSSETLRRWDRQGRIETGRTPTGNRVFSESSIDTLKNTFLHGADVITTPIKEVRSHVSPNNRHVKSSKVLSFKMLFLVLLFLLSNFITVYTLLNYSPFPQALSERIASIEAGLKNKASGLLVNLVEEGIKNEVSVGEQVLLREIPQDLSINSLSLSEDLKVGGDGSIEGTLTVSSESNLYSLNVSNNLNVTGDSLLTGTLNVGGTINGSTLSLTSLIFPGTSASIYPSSSDTSLFLNGGTTGTVNIGNSSTGDIHIGGGSTSSGCTITNNNGSLNCSSNITSGGDLIANGGDLLTDKTTLNLGGSSTAINIPGSLTVTGNSTFNGTATFNSNVSVTTGGQLSLTRVPTLIHTGTWAIGSSTWNESNATIYVNPASATADSNIFALSVGGNVKFDVDAEGDVYANNVILAGSVTSATTTVGTLNVEGNTTLGDATSDTLTINTGTLTWAGGNKTLDITGAATRTLTIFNSTTSNVADLDLSDGDLKLGGTVRISNAGIGTFTTIAGTLLTAAQTNITSVGTLTSLNVSGNTTLGDATTDTLTVNPTTVTFSGGSTTLDLTGTATRTLTLLNSTAGQVADIDLSDGSLLTGGTSRLTNAGVLQNITGYTQSSGTLSITSTTTSGDVLGFTDTSLSAASANLANFTFKNNNTGAGVAVNGVTITEQAAGTPSSGTNTSNLLNLAAAAGGTVNGINISSATGFTNFIKTPSAVLDSSGNLSGVVTLTATTLAGTLSTASQTNVTAVGTLTSLSVTGNINSGSGGLQTNGVTRIDNSGNLTAGTGAFSGTVTVGGGTGKIDVGTVDPPFTIDGKKYATYLSGMTGVKEETAGLVKLQNGKYEIEFTKLPESSDLWLFYQISDFGSNFENLTVLLTPDFEGKVWYKKDSNGKKLTIFSNTNGEISYRLTAPRFDYLKWGNTRAEGVEGFILPEKK